MVWQSRCEAPGGTICAIAEPAQTSRPHPTTANRQLRAIFITIALDPSLQEATLKKIAKSCNASQRSRCSLCVRLCLGGHASSAAQALCCGAARPWAEGSDPE